jgi:hypothetical protein
MLDILDPEVVGAKVAFRPEVLITIGLNHGPMF